MNAAWGAELPFTKCRPFIPHQVDDPEDMVLMRELLAAGLVDTLEMENTG